MTYIATDKSDQGGSPVYLVLFALGSTEYTYTLANQEISYDSKTWVPAPLKLGSIKQTNEISKNNLSISAPIDHEFSNILKAYQADEIISVTVYRTHLTDGDAEFAVTWKGRIVNTIFKRNSLDVDCEPIFTSIKRAGLRAKYQKVCRHALYQVGCNLLESNFSTAATTSAYAGYSITLDVDPNLGDGYFTGGMIKFGGIRRYIATHSGTTITLNRRFDLLTQDIDANGTSMITLYPGCNHTKSECLNKFANLDNFGGFPYIPTDNPLDGTSIA